GADRPDEGREAILRILSNPMDLTTIAQILGRGDRPNLFRLQEQQYRIMADAYADDHAGAPFPLKAFSEAAYQLKIGDAQPALPADAFPQVIPALAEHKMIVPRPVADKEKGPSTRWYFRHDKVADFFLVQAFRDHPELQTNHLGDPRFRGVYLLLARL